MQIEVENYPPSIPLRDVSVEREDQGYGYRAGYLDKWKSKRLYQQWSGLGKYMLWVCFAIQVQMIHVAQKSQSL